MIHLTRFNQQKVVVNADVIAFVEATPDTMITLTNGQHLHVRESVDEVVQAALAFKRRVQTGEG